ncbi:MAG: biotin transporter BioY [Spirochaetales bacterium]|nr:biotin transporter BioY [Spirochaetales bacterium]
MSQEKIIPVKMLVFSALFAACIAIGSYIAIPFGPIPFVLSNFFIFLASLLLGSKWGLLSVSIYLLCGIIGLPVFSQGGAGIAHLLGPTGGYLFGYLFAVWTGGFIAERGKYSILRSGIAVIVAALLIYVVGVPWLKIQTGMTWDKALLAGMIPFLIPDGIKIIAAILIQKAIRPVWNLYMSDRKNAGN